MARQPVPVRLPVLGAAEREHARVLARAVVLEPLGLVAALEVRLRRRRLGEEAPDRVELLGTGEVRGARDRDLRIVELGTGADERERLERLRRAPQEGHEAGVPGDRDDIPVRDRDCVDAMPGLHHGAPHDLDQYRLHETGA